MSFQVTFSDEALAQIEAAKRWWRDHEPERPSHFDEAIRQALVRLAQLPLSGSPYPGRPELRRVLIRELRTHVYYAVDDARRTVVIVAVWHTARGSGPR